MGYDLRGEETGGGERVWDAVAILQARHEEDFHLHSCRGDGDEGPNLKYSFIVELVRVDKKRDSEA